MYYNCKGSKVSEGFIWFEIREYYLSRDSIFLEIRHLYSNLNFLTLGVNYKQLTPCLMRKAQFFVERGWGSPFPLSCKKLRPQSLTLSLPPPRLHFHLPPNPFRMESRSPTGLDRYHVTTCTLLFP